MSEVSSISSVEENPLGDRTPLITPRALLLGALTIAATFYYFTLVAPKSGGRGAVAQYPLTAFLPFVFWIFANVVLKLTVPKLALRQGELLALFVMTWVVAVIPGWMSSWVATLTGATHFATAENSWAEIFFNFVPWHAFPPATQRITDNFWYGLPQGMAVPWDGWIGPLIDWLGVSLAMVVFGYCLLVIFQHQWENNEKLTYPLAQLPVDLTDGFDGKRRFPDIFYKRLFWIGFGVLFLPQLYNIFTYFSPGLPSFDLFWTYYIFQFDDARITSFIRVTPLMLMVIYLCPVDILGSMLLFHVINLAKSIMMRRFGTPSLGFTGVNANNRFSEGQMILHTESHGAMVFFFLWSLWVARRHLKEVWGQVRTGKGDASTVGRYRMAMAGMIVSAIYVLIWALRLGVSLPMALGVIGFMALSYLVTVKLVAASGVAYLYPNRPYVKGESFFLELVGSIYISPQHLVPFKVLTNFAFFGSINIPAWPAITHHLRIFSLRRQPRWVLATIVVAFPVGFVLAASTLIELSYTEGGTLYVGGRTEVFYDGIAYILTNPTQPSLARWAIWFTGMAEAAVITLLRARYHWFPIHPIGLIYQQTHATWWLWINFLIAWLLKLALLRFGGVKAYLAGKPFFFGLGVAYASGVILSSIVDLIWFPSSPHRVHGW